MSGNNTTTAKFLDQLKINYGPRELLSRYFEKAVNAAASRGVYLELGTFDKLMEVNRQNLDTWHPMTTSFNPEYCHLDELNSFAILGRDYQGEIVATQGARFLDWHDTEFVSEATSLRFFYDDPSHDRAQGECCFATAPETTAITGRLMHSGGIWYRSDYRGLKLGEIIPRTARAYAYTTWNIDQAFGITTMENVSKKFHLRVGYREVAGRVTMRRSPTFPEGDLELILCRLAKIDLIDDLFGFLVDFDPEVQTEVFSRRA
ncbi:MAG: hypothetical protein ACR2OV_05565 [Hyphomicrobiaceae bacterium]